MLLSLVLTIEDLHYRCYLKIMITKRDTNNPRRPTSIRWGSPSCCQFSVGPEPLHNVTCAFIQVRYGAPPHRSLAVDSCCAMWASANIATAWLIHRIDVCSFLPERREPHGVPSPYDHSCIVCVTVCLTVMPSSSNITEVSTIGHSFKTHHLPPLFHVA